MPKKISREAAIEQLWELGELSFLLSDVQKTMLNDIENDITKTSVIVCSRRLGKTYLLVTMALAQCLKKPDSIVKFLLPKQRDAKTIIKPLIREITDSCPDKLKPEYNTQDKIYRFHNGSEIHLGGSDLSAESLRGTRADLVLIDEGGFVSDLLYTIRSILSPTIRTTGGRMIIASTPSKHPDHDFVQHFMNPYRASGRLKIYDIYQNPNFTPEIIQEIIDDYPRGTQDPEFRREYLCEVLIDEDSAVCPEFFANKDNIIYSEAEQPEFCDFYVSSDIGFKDLTVVLFGYYNFKEATFYITDELVMNGPEMTTDKLAHNIRVKESINFFKNNSVQEPFKRVMDVDLKLQNDLSKLHGIKFSTTKKDNKEGAINEMRMWVQNNRIKIHESCVHLLYHLEFGQWNKSRNDFKRLADSPDKTVRGGHVDAIPALYYLIRNIKTNRNPYPFGYGLEITRNTFKSPKWEDPRKNLKAHDVMKKLLNIKKKN